MKESTTLNPKLLRYSAAAGSVLAATSLNAQVVSVDINPDVVLTGGSPAYDLDFNNDATPDISFQIQALNGNITYMGIPITYTGFAAGCALPEGNGVVGSISGTGTQSGFDASALSTGTPITSADTFSESSLIALGLDVLADAGLLGQFPVQQGSFLAQDYKYLGVKFSASGNTHYGWVQLSVKSNASEMTIHGYGFQATPDAAINAGEGGNPAGLDQVALEDKVSIISKLNHAVVNVTPDLIGGEILVAFLSGQTVKSMKISDVNNTVSFEGLNTGIYIVSAQFNGGKVNKRVYVK
jgi:hypothetical protein